MMKTTGFWLGAILVGLAIGGCGASDAKVSAKEEEMFKHPAKVDLKSLPPINFSHKGPQFIGKASTATGPSPKQAP